MLKTLDILLGLTVVMLMVSLIVTVLTQFVTNLMNKRGKHLLGGIADMLRQIDPTLTRNVAEQVAGAVLLHPLIRETEKRHGAIIHREELTNVLLELAAGASPSTLEKTAKDALVTALNNNGIKNPQQALDNVLSLALHLEAANPELSNSARHSLALLQEARSQFLAKVNAWFDQTMDRVSERFTLSTRGVTFACGIAVALLLQLDTVALVNRLSTDPELRKSLVQEAVRLEKQAPPAGAAQTPQPAATAKPIIPELTEKDRKNLGELMRFEIIHFPQTPEEWEDAWDLCKLPPKLPGILLTGLLLSLGAPFWYNALKSLVRLRSLAASKDDDQRQERQTVQAAAAPALTSSAELLIGERGDLKIAG